MATNMIVRGRQCTPNINLSYSELKDCDICLSSYNKKKLIN